MSMTQDERAARTAPRGGRWTVVWSALLVAGAAGWFALSQGADPARAWRALLVNFLFFTPLGAGMVLWPAVVMVSHGGWSRPIERWAMAGLVLAPVSLAVFAALCLGAEHWASWLALRRPDQVAWLNGPFLFGRNAVALVLVWGLAAWFVGRLRSRAGDEEPPPSPPRRLAGWFIFAYAMAFTLLAFDFVMALDPQWYSALFGGYFFAGGLYAGLAAWTLVSLLRRGADAAVRHDLGRLIVALSLITTYLMFSQLLPIWYENLPAEVRFVIPRLYREPWSWVSLGLLTTVYLGPLVVLLTQRAKRTAWFLGAVSLVLLVGLWTERWWLVTPTMGGRPVVGLAEVLPAVAFTAALALGVEWAGRRRPEAEP
jgi:hypothetical protein